MISCSISEGYVTKYTAILLRVVDAKDKRDHRYRARLALWSVLESGGIIILPIVLARWLFIKDIPLRCKLRELSLVPWKLWRFLTGRADEAAILQWTGTR